MFWKMKSQRRLVTWRVQEGTDRRTQGPTDRMSLLWGTQNIKDKISRKIEGTRQWAGIRHPGRDSLLTAQEQQFIPREVECKGSEEGWDEAGSRAPSPNPRITERMCNLLITLNLSSGPGEQGESLWRNSPRRPHVLNLNLPIKFHVGSTVVSTDAPHPVRQSVYH